MFITDRKPTRLLAGNLVGLGKEASNAIQITTTSRADATTTVFSLFDQVKLFQSLQRLAQDGSGGVRFVAGARTVVLAGTESLGQTTNTRVGADVQVTSDSS